MANDATHATNPSALSVSDLNTDVNHEPRVSHVRLAQVLGYEQPNNLRRLIERSMDELRRYGDVSVSVTETSTERISSIVEENAVKRGRGRPGKVYWLSEPQALLVCIRSDAPQAPAVRQSLIQVYMDWRRGQPVGLPPRDGMALVRVGEEVVTIDLSTTAQGGEGPWLVTPQGRMRPEIAPRVRNDGPGHGGGRVIIPDGVDERYATLWGRVVARGAVPAREHVVDGAGQPVTLSETEIMLALSLRQEMQRAIGVEIARLRGDVGAALTSALDRAVMAATQRREGAA